MGEKNNLCTHCYLSIALIIIGAFIFVKGLRDNLILGGEIAYVTYAAAIILFAASFISRQKHSCAIYLPLEKKSN